MVWSEGIIFCFFPFGGMPRNLYTFFPRLNRLTLPHSPLIYHENPRHSEFWERGDIICWCISSEKCRAWSHLHGRNWLYLKKIPVCNGKWFVRRCKFLSSDTRRLPSGWPNPQKHHGHYGADGYYWPYLITEQQSCEKGIKSYCSSGKKVDWWHDEIVWADMNVHTCGE